MCQALLQVPERRASVRATWMLRTYNLLEFNCLDHSSFVSPSPVVILSRILGTHLREVAQPSVELSGSVPLPPATCLHDALQLAESSAHMLWVFAIFLAEAAHVIALRANTWPSKQVWVIVLSIKWEE